ncbi:transglycosylase SLT domain-containing protein [Streptomyces sp. NBC_01381]|uniref:transglycosylase SLT domain-containing protein n=1 Tax=Streptomyces sp. NBC_01381 TaxID=2903845 RepID=UPI0022513FED|nr:transglycosylase SLT domain-containing protein [Streptomyces sp. NBC_01381]MCX4668229.1 transglycosylase SLT domain-containing protein [Streptomyces sp. NBC_01381]
MPQHNTPGHSRPALTKIQKFSIAGVATLGAAALAFSLVPGSAEAGTQNVTAAPVAFKQNVDAQQAVEAGVIKQHTAADKQAKDAVTAKQKADADAAAKKKAAEEAAAKKKAEDERKAKEAASRAAARKPVYANNLDGWIRQSLDIMKSKGIPGSYEGLHRNIMRESTGNPNAVNGWDINAINGTPSIGLLQVIQPTFDAYHVSGTSTNIYDPVANITAAANYAADKYGSMDNVNGAY